MSGVHRSGTFIVRRCIRCTLPAVVVVPAYQRTGTIAACTDHLEWLFFAEVGGWSKRRKAA